MIENIIKERINNNKNIFTKEELEKIEENSKLIYKVYLLGLLDNIF